MIAGFDAFDGWDASARRDIEYNNAAKLFPRLARDSNPRCNVPRGGVKLNFRLAALTTSA